MNTNVKFVAEVKHVKEVILDGEADLTFWQAQLSNANLYPYNHNNRAEISISTTDLYWMGLHSNELTIGISVSERPEADTRDGVYLIHAFNSSALLAFMERTFFQTPYYPARIHLNEQPPAQIQLSDSRGVHLYAQMGAGTVPTQSKQELWQGISYLPVKKPSAKRRYFVVCLSGFTQTYPFSPLDKLTIASGSRHPVFTWLRESYFAPKGWRLRADADHSRSSTFTRP